MSDHGYRGLGHDARALAASARTRIETFARQHELGEAFVASLPEVLAPLALWLSDERARRSAALVFGIAGAQGSGKSTLAGALCLLLDELGLGSTALSLDDFYLTREERRRLAREVHPLLATRGVPGTHDVALALATLARLRDVREGSVACPRFDKARDDRAPQALWNVVALPLDVVIFEGWCLGCPPQAEAALVEPVNELERREDADGRLRRLVNAELGGRYRDLFGRIDRLLFLRVPDLAFVRRARARQEEQLLRELLERDPGARHAAMAPAQLERFIQHFERLTLHMLEVMPDRADLCLARGAGGELARVTPAPRADTTR